uniref:2-isopropylmalate synthase n=1 Tax=Rhodosorus marinus TaxID=101924 RepID=A0A7S3EHY3_9RHOD|mmetsp:Transcript_3395/g.15976  ORF Transcript_3395/g.15976 Transcript_3395/m.15976 type:complete len:611 (+) Transcript_3395:332-2164(+)
MSSTQGFVLSGVTQQSLRKGTFVGSEACRPGRRLGFSLKRATGVRMTTTQPQVDLGKKDSVFVAPVPTKHDLATGRDPARVKIFDTTLRDGEQSPGASLTGEEKLILAKQLAKLGVDIIEAGFPIASVGDFEAVKTIAQTVGCRDDPPIICGLSRARKPDIDRCWEAVKHASFPRIHTFIATSDLHMEYKLKKTPDEVLEATTEMVSYARSLCEDVEFSAEDATRSDPEFLYKVYSRAIAAGATTLNVPDTVGYTTPDEYGALIRGIRENVEGIENLTISLHGHNDLGLAVANFLSGVENGARQIETTINGIGERAGNAAMEEIVMALQVRRQYYSSKLHLAPNSFLTNINHREIYNSSRMVSNMTGMSVQPNKAIVGANAFAHESGIHQDGILKNRLTYEIMDAKSIGHGDNSLVLGKLSGRAAFRARLTEMGYEISDEELNKAFIRFKDLADKKKEVTDWDLESIISDEVKQLDTPDVRLVRVQVQCGEPLVPTATVTLDVNGVESTASSVGTGPVDAAFQGVQKICFEEGSITLLEYKVNSVTKGIDALGEVMVQLKDHTTGKTVNGSSANTDVVVASTTAYVQALNRVLKIRASNGVGHPQKFVEE